ncbi:Trk system potassium uptake protein [Dinoroseobacter shibae DFL 12 = DSM 16493]|jgi:trk system potassium uptake protein TrkH|uniref:Trk system potassium uptake protein n=1 Tax=Dinoroseobacter shibae (strain DSM 16493 / NCIMB 14021 / DFL 12) TaxID=398580 RepID=A8LS49_DINSH|nr:TrkH family potassium uptake protein [Dinoroseobacter shibae]ABV94142.1 Trk system potassium uptake protein [Dinoroseobacter shibae DFL 12 = DSM 16493]URF45582.1 TrkH family potassium uptake protein [Dinoroseobacter shibae]URF49887.1 TrkH family potassium uptake protein [Dinoroseobacter shibae]
MFDLRPVGYVIGLLVAALGASMLVPMALDLIAGNGHWPAFLESAILSGLVGGLTAIACANGVGDRLNIQQTFLLTTGVWLALPVFAALPFVFGATEARYVDAFFEAMSGLTTTGSTVFTGLETLPPGLLLWRGMMQWFGGVGIIVVAMVFLPELRIGGMQIFRSEGFDTIGKILPRATQIASRISVIYLGLTGACALTYLILGMTGFDAVVHAMTTVATGGFANSDASFGAFPAAMEYAATLFMLLAALPFVRYVQLVAGTARPLLHDPQVRAFFATVAVIVLIIATWKMIAIDTPGEESLRKSLFNTVSIITGTGYASADYMLWGAFPVVVLFFAGLIGGCAGSTACSIKVFRYQLLIASIVAQIRRIHSPHGMFTPRYGGKPVTEDVLSSVMAFFVMFTVSLGILSVLLALTGLDFITSVSGAATALGNIGPGLGDQIGPAGNFAGLNDTAKWILSAAMLIGRLELMVVFALFTVRFWRA